MAVPFTAVTGLATGAVGISGRSFKVPLLVLLCGVPKYLEELSAENMLEESLVAENHYYKAIKGPLFQTGENHEEQ